MYKKLEENSHKDKEGWDNTESRIFVNEAINILKRLNVRWAKQSEIDRAYDIANAANYLAMSLDNFEIVKEQREESETDE